MKRRPVAEIEQILAAHHGVITMAEANKAGLSRHVVRGAVVSGMLHTLCRGVYTLTSLWRDSSPDVQHLLVLLAHQRTHPDLVACESSAAIVHRLPIPGRPPTEPRFTVPRIAGDDVRGGRGHRDGMLGRRSTLQAGDIVTTLGGIRVTSAMRTVLDCARTWNRYWGLAVADAALAAGTLDVAGLADAVARAPWSGQKNALWVVEHTRPKVESPLESLARAVIVIGGEPEPQIQVWVRTRMGRFRVDLADLDAKVVIEADGKIKYRTPEDVWQEKQRQDAIRDAGFEVTRFTMADYHARTLWLQRYRRARQRGGDGGSSR